MSDRATGWLFRPLLLVAVLTCAGTTAAEDSQPFREYEVKAAFLFNFAQYVNWPATAFAETNSPIVIGVLGKDPFESHLDNAITNEKVQGRPLKVRRSQHGDVMYGCHILFISASEKDRLKDVLAVFRDLPVLTVSDIDEFAEHCGGVGFVVKEKRVTLHINHAAATRAGVKIDSRLLGLATIVPCVEGR